MSYHRKLNMTSLSHSNMDYYYYLDNGSYIPILELNMILTLPYHYTLITISINDRFIIFLSKMIAIPIILTNNASDAFYLVRIELIEYMPFYLTNLFTDVL